MGEIPNIARGVARTKLGPVMKGNQEKKALTLGGFIMAAHDVLGKQARGIVWLAVNAHLVQFQGRQRFLFSKCSLN